MAQTHKQLAQSNPGASSDTTVYTVPGATTTLVYGIVIANTDVASGKARVQCVPNGGSPDTTNAIYYDIVIPGNDTFVANISVDMPASSFISVRSDSGKLVFTISGMEIA